MGLRPAGDRLLEHSVARFWQGRWPILSAIAVVAVIFGVGWLVTDPSYLAWRLMGVDARDPTFADLRTITPCNRLRGEGPRSVHHGGL